MNNKYQKWVVKSIFSILFLAPFISNAQSNWGKEVWDAYMNSCISSAKDGMSEKMAKSYCACTAEKLEFRYPDANDLGTIQQDEITELATICLEEVNSNEQTTNKTKIKSEPPKPMNSPSKSNNNSVTKSEFIGPTNWSKTGYDTFMNSCVESAKSALGEKDAKKYCDCSASKIQKLYPDENKVYVTEEEINKIAEECIGN